MKVAALLAVRRKNWHELESLSTTLESSRQRLSAAQLGRFAALYRGACADLALADAYQLPADVTRYLHQLVGRAHNQLYRSRGFRLRAWFYQLLFVVPKRLYNDNALRLAFVLFWGFFLLSMYLAHTSRQYAEGVLGKDGLMSLEEMYHEPLAGRDPSERAIMAGYYIRHNTGIGLQCFAMGLLGGVGGLLVLLANALQLGAAFGHMTTVDARQNFFQFVTAHGPFELTAIVLSAAAGMRMGFALIHTHGWTRRDALRLSAQESMPIVGAAMVLFALAAFIEAFVSPSSAPYLVKAAVAAVSSLLLLFYFVLLGQPGFQFDGLADAVAPHGLRGSSETVSPAAPRVTPAAPSQLTLPPAVPAGSTRHLPPPARPTPPP